MELLLLPEVLLLQTHRELAILHLSRSVLDISGVTLHLICLNNSHWWISLLLVVVDPEGASNVDRIVWEHLDLATADFRLR